MPMWLLGLIIVLGVACYGLFAAADRIALEPKTGAATVTAKSYRQAGQDYTTEIIAGQPRAIPRARGEAYVLALDVAGTAAEVKVDRSVFDAAREGEHLQIVYTRRRLTGAIQVVSVRPR